MRDAKGDRTMPVLHVCLMKCELPSCCSGAHCAVPSPPPSPPFTHTPTPSQTVLRVTWRPCLRWRH